MKEQMKAIQRGLFHSGDGPGDDGGLRGASTPVAAARQTIPI